MTDIHSIVRLLKNHLYATYQLHAVMANKRITPEEGLKRGALTVIDWICQRLGGDVPSSLQVPKPEEYANFDSSRLVSVHLNYGFVIDVVSLPEKGIWSLQITEPDLGSDPGNPHQGRQPVAGRIFETDVAFLVQDNELEIGVKTIISDPVGSALADVYRPAFVKKLYNDPEFGLKHLIPIEPKLHPVQNQEQLKRVLHLYHHTENQLPLVLFSKIRKNISEEHPAMPGLTLNQLQTGEALHKDFKLSGGQLLKNSLGKGKNPIFAKEKAAKGHQKGKPREWNGAAMKSFRDFKVKGLAGSDQIDSLRILNGNPFAEALKPADPSKHSTSFQTVFPPYDVKRFAASLAGFAHVFLLEPELLDTLNQLENLELRSGDVLILEPQCFQGGKKIFPLAQAKQNTRLLWQYLYTYPREKAFDFGNVYFLSGAQEALVHSGQEAQNLSLRQAERYATEQEVQKAQWQERLKEKDRALAILESKLHKQEQQMTIAGEKATNERQQLQQEIDRQEKLLLENEDYIRYLKERIARPHTKKELSGWAESQLSDHLVLLPKALSALDAASLSSDRVEEVYDSLEFLAHECWESRYAGLTEEQLLLRCSLKYNKKFEITPNSDSSINTYPGQYKVFHYKEPDGNEVTKELKYHLKSGNKAEHLVRIYFFFDDARRLIVVGSLPDHLDTVLY